MQLYNVLTNGKKYKDKAFALYLEAFPQEERKPPDLLERLGEEGKQELLAIAEGDTFVGLAFNMVEAPGSVPPGEKETAILDYFAIAPELRGGGYGTRALKLLLERFVGKTYIFEVEMRDEKAANAKERERRMAFYLRNGLKEAGLRVRAYGTDFEILAPDGMVTYDQYLGFLRRTLGDQVMKHVVNPDLLK